MIKYLLGAVAVFSVSSFWLYLTMSSGYATNNWVATPATIGIGQADRNLRDRQMGLETPVTYKFEGVIYDKVVQEFLVPGKGTVYVNPNDPSQVVGVTGPCLQNFGRPMILTIVSGLLIVVLGLIALSPKDDFSS